MSAKRRERAPKRRRESDGNAGRGIAEGLDEVARQSLEAVDVAPGRLPRAEVGGKFVRSFGQRLQENVGNNFGADVVAQVDASFSRVRAEAALQVVSPKHGERRGHGGCAPTQLPAAQRVNLLRGLRLQGIIARRSVPGFDQRGDRPLKPRQIAVVGGGDERIERKILFVLQHTDGVHAARGFSAGFDIRRKIFLLRAVRARRGPRPIVGVVEPAVFGVQEVGRFIDRKQAVPVGRGIAAVHRLGPIEAGIAAGNEVAVKVGDIAVGIGEDGIVRRVGVQLHGLAEGFVVIRLGAQIRLRQGLDGLVHQPDSQPLAVGFANHRAMLRAVHGELFLGHAVGGFVRHGDFAGLDRKFLVAVLIEEAVAFFLDGLEIKAELAHSARGMHPAGAVVESLIDEKLAPGDGTVGVKTVFAGHLQFGAKEKRGVRIDEQQRVMVHRV